MSYYALFKWWLLLSQHPSCLCKQTVFTLLSLNFGTLAVALGSFPLGHGPYRSCPHSRVCHTGIRSSSGFGTVVTALAQLVALPPADSFRGCPSRHFGEYELSPSLIGLSPLSTAHPSSFQPTLVRTSIQFYLYFILAMDRSPGFASTACYFRSVRTCFRCGCDPEGLNLATYQ